MTESEIAARIAARRTELDELEEGLVKQLAEVRAERDELAVAERVWQRMAGQLADEVAVPAPVTAQVAGQGVFASPRWRQVAASIPPGRHDPCGPDCGPNDDSSGGGGTCDPASGVAPSPAGLKGAP